MLRSSTYTVFYVTAHIDVIVSAISAFTLHSMIQTWHLVYLLSILLVASFHRDADDCTPSAPPEEGGSPPKHLLSIFLI